MKTTLRILLATVMCAATLVVPNALRAAELGWSGFGTGAGSGANSTWLTAGNWTNNLPLPSTNDSVVFGLGGSATTIGINFNGINVTNTYLGALALIGGSTVDRIIGNSSTTAGGTLSIGTLNGGFMTNNVSGRTLTLAPFGGGSGTPMTITLLSNATFSAAAGASNVVTAIILGTANITNTGAGQLALLNTNTFNGKVVLNAGTLLVTNETGLGTNTGSFLSDQLTLQGGTLRTTNSTNSVTIANTNRGITLGTGGGTFLTEANTILAVPIAGSTTLTKSGTTNSVLSLSATNSNFTGAITVNFGGINAKNSSSLGTGTKTVSIANGSAGMTHMILDTNGTVGAAADINLPSTISLTTSYSVGTVTNTSGNNVIQGNITLSAGGGGTYIVANGGTLTLRGTLAPNTTGRDFKLGGTATGTNTVAGPITGSGANAMTLTKADSGTWNLTGTNTFTGVSTITGGTLNLGANGSISNSPVITMSAGTIFNVAAVSGGFALETNQTLNGAGTVIGNVTFKNGSTNASSLLFVNSVTMNSGSKVQPGGFFAPGTMVVSNALTLAGGNPLNFDLGTTPLVNSGSNDLIVVNGNLSINGPAPITFGFPLGQPQFGVPYTLFRYSGVLSGAANLSVVGVSPGVSAVLDSSVPGYITVTFTAAAPNTIVWTGTNGFNWDLATSLNFSNAAGAAVTFGQFDNVLLDDSSTNQAVTLVGNNLQPTTTTVNSSSNYFLSGSGAIAGGSVTKSGSGTLTVSTPNTYSGATLIQGGTLKAGHATALGNANGATIISSGATLDVNAQNLGQEPVTVAGAGVGGLGAIVNSGGQQLNAIKFLTLAGDTTFGGTGRWDTRSSSGNALLSSGGQPYKITKVGANLVVMVDTVVDPALGDIDVQAGTFSTETFTQLGDPTKTMTVWSNAIFRYFNNTVPITKVMVMSNTAKFQVDSAVLNAFNGRITLAEGTNVFDIFPSSTLTVTGNIAGAAALMKTNTGTLSLFGTNTYTGLTIISNGLLQGTTFSLPGAITNNAGLVINQNFDGTLLGPVTGTGGTFIKRGTGRLTITNPMGITGTVTNEAGVIVLGADNVLGTGLQDWRGVSPVFPAFESADASTRTITNSISISTDARLGSTGSGNLVFSGPINNGSSQKVLFVTNTATFSSGFNNLGIVVKEGPGQMVLGGANNNTGLVISNGSIALAAGGYFSNNPAMTILSGASLDVSPGSGATFTNISGKTFIAGRTNGAGTDLLGSLQSTGTVTLGFAVAPTPATLTVSGNALIAGGTVNFDLANTTTTGAGVNDFISVGGTITLANTITINVSLLNGSLANGTYTLMTGTAPVAGAPTFTLTGTNGSTRQTASVAISGNSVVLNVAGVPLGNALTWLGTNVNWDLGTTNFTNTVLGAVDRFFNNDSVLFDNTSANTNVQITVAVSPSVVTVNSSSNYTFGGAGSIAGGASIAKSGTGTLTLGNANTYFGPVNITGGTLKQGNAGAVGNSSGVTVGSGGQFDFAGVTTTSKALGFNIAGTGADGLGAIKNTGTSVSGSAISNVTLTADAAIGAFGTDSPNFGRMDIGVGYGLLNGNGNKLTKTGPGYLDLRSSTINLPEIIVAGGTLYSENIDNNLGAKVTVLTGARLGGTGGRIYTNQVDLANGSVFFTAVGTTASTWNGPVNAPSGNVFIGNTTISAGAGAQDLRITSPITGAANLTVAVHPLELSANNDATFSGNITVNATTLRLTNNGTAGTGVITNNSGTVDFNPGAAYGFARTIYGPAGTVSKSGTNTLQLTGAGGDQISDGQVLNVLAGAFDLNGRSEAVRGLAGNAGAVVTNSAAGTVSLVLTNPNANPHIYNGSIGGPITVVIRDSATRNGLLQSFTATNGFTGGLVIDNGQLRASGDFALGAVPAVLDPVNIIFRNAGALQNNVGTIFLHPNRGVRLESDGLFMVGFNAGNDIVVNGPISGAGRLLKGDGQRLILKNANTFTGDTVFTNVAGVGQGTLRIDHALALQNSTFDATGLGGQGTLDLNNMDVVVGMLKGSGATIANFNGRLTAGGNGQNGVFGSVLLGAGNLVKVGGGTLVLSAANNPYNGGTIVSNGTLISLGNLTGFGGVIVKSGATFGANGGVAGSVTVEPGGSLYPGASPGTLTISNHLAFSSGSLFYELSSQALAGLGLNDLIDVKSNLTLTGTSNFRFQFLNGVPALGVPYTLIRYAGTLTGGASNLTASASRYSATFDSSVTGEIRVTFNGAGSNLVWTGSATNNTWNLNRFTNFFNGLALDTFKDGDSVTFNDSGYSGSPVLLTGTLAPVSLVVSNETSDYTFAGPNGLNLFQGFTKRGAARLALTGTNEALGRIDVFGGALVLNADDSLGVAPALPIVRLALDGGRLEAAGTFSLNANRLVAVGPQSGNGSGIIDVATGQTLTLNGLVTNNVIGNGTLVKRGAGTLALANANNAWSGGTIISKGTVLARNDNALGSVGIVTLGDAGTGTDPVTFLVDGIGSGGNRTIARDIGVSSAGSGPVIIGSTAQSVTPGTIQVNLSGNITLTNHDLYLRTGSGDFTRQRGDIAGTGNLFITNGSLNGDMRGNSGNRLILDTTPKTFTGDITILGGGIVSPLLTNFTVLQLDTANILRDSINITVQSNAVLRVNADEIINGLGGDGRVRGVVALRTLGVGASNATSVLNGPLENDPFDAGSLALTKYGSGTLTLNGTNTHTGITVVGGGALALGANASLSNSPSLILSNGTTLNATAIAGGFNLMGNQSLVSGGTVLGNLTAATNATLTPGHTNVVGTLSVGGNLTLNGNRLNFELGGVPAGPGNDQIAASANLALSGLSIVTVTPVSSLAVGTYRLISYGGTKTAGGLANLSLVMTGTRFTAALADNAGGIDLVVSSGTGGNLVWAANFTNSLWDINTTTNWLNGGVLGGFFQGDIAAFDSTAQNSNVTLNVTVTPGSVAVSGATNYVVSGTGKISGTASYTKSGSGTNTVSTANDYTGLTTISGGMYRLGSSTALGSIVGGTIINSGATLDLNARTGVFEPITVSGAGVLANGVPMGAIVNYGAAVVNDGLRGVVTLAGDTTIGGANRWDMFGGTLLGNNFKLTKTNTIEISLSNLGETGLGDIDIQQGLLTFLGPVTMGNPARTVFVYPGATLHFWAMNNFNAPISKNVILTNATIQSGSGNNFIGGAIQMVTNGIFNPSGGNIYFNGTVSGDNLTKNGANIMGLYGTHTHTGSNLLNAGTLLITSLANGGLPSGLGQSSADPTNLTFNGGTLSYFGPAATTDRGFRLAGAGTLDLTNDVTMSGGFYGAGAFNKTGPGKLVLSGNTTNTSGQFQVRQGTLVLGNTIQSNTINGELWAGHGGSPGATVVITGGTNNVSGFLAVARDANTGDSMLYMTGGRFTAANGSLAFQGTPAGLASVVLSNNAFLNIANSGTAFHGAESANTRAQIIVDSGATFKVNATAELGLSGSLTGRFSGTIELGVMQVGANNNSTGIVYQTGGTVTQTGAGDARIGGANAGPNSLGIYEISTGTLNLGGNNFQIGAFGQGYLNQSGGVVTSGGYPVVGRFAGGVGVLNVTGGQFLQTGVGTRLIVGEAGTGTMNVGGTGLVDSTGGLRVGNVAGGIGVVNLLSGGVIAAPLVEWAAGSGTFNFNGGTLRAKANNATYFQGLTAANVLGGGARLDSDGFGITIAQPLLAGAGAGGLTKINPGSVTLNAVDTYAGSTLINGGTLALGSAGTINNSPLVAVAAGAVFDVTAKGIYLQPASQTLAGNGLVSGLVLAAGTVAPGASIGTLTFDSPLTLAGSTVLEIDRGALPNADLIIAPALTNGGTLIVTNLGAALMALDTFNLFDASSFNGTFASIVLPPLTGGLVWDLSQLYVDGTIRVVVPPSIVTAPAPQTAQCSGSATFTVTAAGTAPLSYQWRSNSVTITGANGPSLTLINLNLASSGSFDVIVANGGGSVTSASAALTVQDTTAPVATCSTNIVAECTSSNGAVVTFTASATDTCDASPSVVCVPVSGSTFALGTNVVTCTATDGSGNTNACTFTVAVLDTTPPSITTCATNRTLSANAACQVALPDFTTEVVATDVCGSVVITQSPAAGTLVGLGATLVTITVSDLASNSVTCPVTITVIDTTAPTLVCPGNTTVQCDADVPVANFAGGSVSDNCDASPVVTHVSDVSSGSCPKTITRTYRATDASGNTNDCAQIITVHDTTPPMLTCPGPVSVQCPGNVPPPNVLLVGASDNCDPSPVVTYVGDESAGVNPTIITRTYRATDFCGNTNDCAQIITVHDTVAPVITTCASSSTIVGDTNGIATVPDKRGEVSATDNCGPLTITQVPAPGSMVSTGVHVLTFTAIDSASNTSACTATLTVVAGAIPPTFLAQPTNATVECSSNATFTVSVDGTAPFAYQWYFGTNSIVDATNATLVLIAVTDANEGSYSVIVTNAGGSVTSSVVTLTVVDTRPPLITCPAPVTVQCDADVPAANFAGGSVLDGCDTMPVVTHVSDVAAGSCPKIITRTYRATDASGNTNDCAQTITVHDTTPPVVTCVAPQTYQAGVAWSFTAPGASDNCGGAVNVTPLSTATNHTCGLTFIATRIWQAMDACGNSSTCTQVVTVVDTTAPTITCPAPASVQCDADVPAANFAGGSVTDAGDTSPIISHVSDVAVGSCPKIITRTYRATDACGNTNDCAQIITVHDTIPPVAHCPSPIVTKSASTNGGIVNYTATATDNCTASPALGCVPPSGSLFPIGASTVVCAATDACGNSNGCSFTVTVYFADGTNKLVNAPVPDIPSLGLSSVLNVTSPIGTLTDVNVTLNLSNGWNGDLFAYLVHESGYTVLLNRVGKRNDAPLGYSDSGMNITLDDQAANDVHIYRLSLFGNHSTPLAGPLTNAWQPDGRALDPALVLDTSPRTDLLASFNGLNPNGEWVLYVEDDASGDTSTLVSWGLELCGTLGVSPAISMPPQNVATNCGSTAAFSVTATGTGPVGYQWLKNGSAIPGATLASFVINNAHPTDNGTYSVVASNAFGTASSSATLVVTEPNLPVIVTQPQSVTNNVGTTATLSVAATSCSALTYQWCYGASPLAGRTNATLVIPNIQLADQGSYLVKVSNAAGTTTSAVAVVTVNRPPVALDNGGATIQGQALAIAIEKLLANDTDADGDPLSVVSVSATSTNGGAVVMGGGKVTYTPLPAFVGTDRYTYTISDGRGGSATAAVEVLVVSGSLPSLNQVTITPTPNGYLIRFAGIPGYSYKLQRSPTVAGPWTTITTQTAPLHGIIQYEDVNPPPGTGFYRTVAP